VRISHTVLRKKSEDSYYMPRKRDGPKNKLNPTRTSTICGNLAPVATVMGTGFIEYGWGDILKSSFSDYYLFIIPLPSPQPELGHAVCSSGPLSQVPVINRNLGELLSEGIIIIQHRKYPKDRNGRIPWSVWTPTINYNFLPQHKISTKIIR